MARAAARSSARKSAAERPAAGKPVTVTRIAEETGLAASTVSLILNGHARKLKISTETEQRVFDLARRLKYVPNDLARSLRSQKTGVIGVVFGNLYNGWAQKILEGVHSVFDEAGYVPFMAIHNWDLRREASEVHSLIQRRVEGMICVPQHEGQPTYRDIVQRGMPLVLLGDTFEDLPEVSFVGWDSAQAARVLMRHLVETGRRRIGFLTANHPTIGTRARGEAYHQVLHEAGLAPDPRWVGACDVEPSATRMVEKALDQIFRPGQPHPDALFVLNDGLALPALGILEARGFRVPEDVAVVGMGNMPGVSHPRIGLTTVSEPLEEIGRQVAHVILRLIREPEKAPVKHLVEGTDLFIRSTTVPRSGDEAVSAEGGWRMG